MPNRIICQHVAEDPQVALHGDKKSNRVCCPACYEKGFLSEVSWLLDLKTVKGKLVGNIKKGTK